MNRLKGDIRIVHNPSAGFPDELPAFLNHKSHKARTVYRVLRELMGGHHMSELMMDFYTLTEVPMAVIDLDANVLASSKWESLCTEYHRVNPDTCRRCIESDIELANRLDEGAEFTMYTCKNGLVDCVSPIIIDDEHVANMFIGQFLLQAPDYSFFQRQSEEFGFDPEAYINALDQITIIAEAKIPAIMRYLRKSAQMVATMAYDRYNAMKAEKEHRKKLEAMILERTRQLQIIDNFQTQFIAQSDPVDMYGYFRDELLSLTDSQFGFIGETQTKDDGTLSLKIYGPGDMAGNGPGNQFFHDFQTIGFESADLDNLFGRVIIEKKVMINNHPDKGPKASRLPYGHPALQSFLGLPVFYGDRLVGEICLANRTEGYDQKIVDLLTPLLKTCGQIIVARQDKEAKQIAELKLKEQAQKDGLTGLYNRRYFNETIEKEYRRCSREKQELSLIMVDVDLFKAYNDRYGHLKGDNCLKTLTSVFQRCLRRPADLFARYGGEEFVGILPNTSMAGAIRVAQRINAKIAEEAIEHAASSVSPLVTVSIGIASRLPKGGTEAVTLINEADGRLYQAKKEGRNRIISKG